MAGNIRRTLMIYVMAISSLSILLMENYRVVPFTLAKLITPLIMPFNIAKYTRRECDISLWSHYILRLMTVAPRCKANFTFDISRYFFARLCRELLVFPPSLSLSLFLFTVIDLRKRKI